MAGGLQNTGTLTREKLKKKFAPLKNLLVRQTSL